MALPTPGVTPANWGAQLNAEIEARAPSPVYMTNARYDGGSTFFVLGASSFTTIDFGQTPGVNVGGGTWDDAADTWTVPASGRYLITAFLRGTDGLAARSLGVGVHTSNADGAHFQWASFGGSGSYSRNGVSYTRIDSFAAGDPLRLFAYSEGASVDVTAVKLTIDRVA